MIENIPPAVSPIVALSGLLLSLIAMTVQICLFRKSQQLRDEAKAHADHAQLIYDSARSVSGYIYEQMDMTPPPQFTSGLNYDAQQPYFAGTITGDGMIASNLPVDTGDVNGLPPAIRADLERLLSFDWGDVPPELPPSGEGM